MGGRGLDRKFCLGGRRAASMAVGKPAPPHAGRGREAGAGDGPFGATVTWPTMRAARARAPGNFF